MANDCKKLDLSSVLYRRLVVFSFFVFEELKIKNKLDYCKRFNDKATLDNGKNCFGFSEIKEVYESISLTEKAKLRLKKNLVSRTKTKSQEKALYNFIYSFAFRIPSSKKCNSLCRKFFIFCGFEEDKDGNIGCSGCTGCENCIGCINCQYCKNCRGCAKLSHRKNAILESAKNNFSTSTNS